MRKRNTARLILLNPNNQIYLMKIKPNNIAEKNSKIGKSFWVTIGGGIKNNETVREALNRELYEETGIRDAVIHQLPAWYGEVILTCNGKDVLFCEKFFVAHSKNSDISHDGLYSHERDVLCDHKWWEINELKNSNEIFIPKNLHKLLLEITNNEGLVEKTRVIDLSIK